MSDKHNGGPAFPQGFDSGNYDAGMSLRDWFAGQAIRARWGDGTAMTTEQAATMAYQLADAMLEERGALAGLQPPKGE